MACLIIFQKFKWTTKDYPLEEEPPEFSYWYKLAHISVEDSAANVCSKNSAPLRIGTPKLNIGCDNPVQIPGFTFSCKMKVPVTCELPRPYARQAFFQFLNQATVNCSQVVEVGSADKDGSWEICMTSPYSLVKSSCLVYSFG